MQARTRTWLTSKRPTWRDRSPGSVTILKIVQVDISYGADYVLSLKDHQKYLFEDVRYGFTGRGYKHHSYENLEKDHGCIEMWIETTLSASEVFNESEYRHWRDIRSLAPEDCAQIGKYIRGHWSIENRLNWHLDVTFREYTCRSRKDHSASNLNTLRKLALAIVSEYKEVFDYQW